MRIALLSFMSLALLAGCGSSSDSNSNKTSGVGGAGNAADSGSGAGTGGGTDASMADGPCTASGLVEGSTDFPFNGTAFKYVAHLPPSYDGTKRVPLVLNWHGLTSTAAQQVAFSGMNPVADDNGFIVVYPDSPTNSWNAGTCCAFNDTTRDDVGFARALVQEIQSKACIDSKRIYTTGMSNGAFMSYRLGCEAADLFAAIAPVAGKVGIPNCSPSRTVPLMAFHGTADPLVAYDTGSLSADNLSVPDTVKKWADGDGCTSDPQVTYQQGTVTCNTWSTCKDGATVTLCTAEGEGHCWPGTALCPFGAYTTDINASQEIAKFFAKFSLP